MTQLELIEEKNPNKTRHSDTHREFGSFQSFQRGKYGVTQEQLAKAIGYGHTTVYHVEAGDRKSIDPEYMRLVKKYFKKLSNLEYRKKVKLAEEQKARKVKIIVDLPPMEEEVLPNQLVKEITVVCDHCGEAVSHLGVIQGRDSAGPFYGYHECKNSIMVGTLRDIPQKKIQDFCPHCLGEIGMKHREFVGDGWEYCTKCLRLLKYLTPEEVKNWKPKTPKEEDTYTWMAKQEPITELQIRMWYDDMRGLIRGIYLGIWALVFTLLISQFFK